VKEGNGYWLLQRTPKLTSPSFRDGSSEAEAIEVMTVIVLGLSGPSPAMGFSFDRVLSSIPRAPDAAKGTACPNACAAQETKAACPYKEEPQALESESDATASVAASSNWVYPSPQMFYDAMARKGSLPAHLKDAEHGLQDVERELDWIVTLHNIVNEQAWQEILQWEQLEDGNGSPALLRFLGRPNDLSPRAWLRSNLLGCQRPFDRHDWYVRRLNGTVHRYVIDFYPGKPKGNEPAAFHLDVRPALDSFGAAKLRARRIFSKLFE
jgi:hypothetical protein